MIILAIDTSFDETSVAVVDDRQVLSNVISSQVRYHKKFGGVVPFLAQRLHKERIDAVIELALQRADLSWHQIEAIAITQGPGLAPALEVGIQKAKDLAALHTLPLYPVNHMAGHIASCFAWQGSKKPKIAFPTLALLVSGKHTDLVYMEKFGSFTILGETLDDAVGEAYDKAARMLGLGYPGGRLLARFAQDGNPSIYNLPVPMLRSGDLNFSYSGLKNAVRLVIEAVEKPLTAQKIANIAASFQKVTIQSLLVKLEKALQTYPDSSGVLLAGGVAANAELRKGVRAVVKRYNTPLFVPASLKLCTDNAAMIGVAASMGIENGLQPVEPEKLERRPSLRLS